VVDCPQQSNQHAAYDYTLGLAAEEVPLGDATPIHGKPQMHAHFIGGPKGDFEIPTPLPRRGLPAALGNVRGDRVCGPLQLASQARTPADNSRTRFMDR
jgi:hypothetical protein